MKEKPARSGFENGFVQSLPSQCDAAAEGETAVVELLLAANAPVDVQNKKGWVLQFGHDSFGFY